MNKHFEGTQQKIQYCALLFFDNPGGAHQQNMGAYISMYIMSKEKPTLSAPLGKQQHPLAPPPLLLPLSPPPLFLLLQLIL